MHKKAAMYVAKIMVRIVLSLMSDVINCLIDTVPGKCDEMCLATSNRSKVCTCFYKKVDPANNTQCVGK